ncbi:sigma-70 family RNA polymerase sigma factor [Faecalicatena contorta]|uniref:Sigma-70 family RNA polymerase sigma factor n=1 Tax=Faecalicatena fissicatena TaxID=290055 RepID=A0ABS2EA09_9FIRM|nr:MULTISPECIES: sigma-70 family RNA polymerase sigma factor [Faecalicatena]MBM6685119.1 sigma-70 family RNA polymerase sigma factor [Faecalicatena contorta]MBM6710966.1 sigma-70 family RNA polymerase sigma factor [Faecalicatena contorta]MBM6738455.1 sigma-70 family RNA polymerase sigma factor [Faecalicatena fissicatena]HIX98352.1 sigma-70 family RNA polymerase sigma factor [Candidatus Dorea intestinigallinarum]
MKENDVGIEFIGRQGFDAVYEKYKNLIFQTAFLYIKEWYAAEDIMQETFLRYYIYMEHTRVENTKYWLLTTAKNITLNYIRDNSRSTVLDMEDEEEGVYGSVEGGEEIFFDKLWRKEVLEAADTILDALYRKNRRWYDAVTLVYCMEKPQKEVAACMDMSLESLQSMLYRARNWIKKNYREEFDHIHEA